ncbi:hypothetical protein ABW19_dt0205795 [Dactylella cylindrospora]|nr:hypothetical protein ABW19_dt0205795 [Dactylella cylindrospora]
MPDINTDPLCLPLSMTVVPAPANPVTAAEVLASQTNQLANPEGQQALTTAPQTTGQQSTGGTGTSDSSETSNVSNTPNENVNDSPDTGRQSSGLNRLQLSDQLKFGSGGSEASREAEDATGTGTGTSPLGIKKLESDFMKATVQKSDPMTIPVSAGGLKVEKEFSEELDTLMQENQQNSNMRKFKA